MANFMIAHLQDGRLGSARILSETTARQMHSRLFTHAPELNAMLHGFYEMNENGEKIYGHEATLPGFTPIWLCFRSTTSACSFATTAIPGRRQESASSRHLLTTTTHLPTSQT
jgi:hypothetical protein